MDKVFLNWYTQSLGGIIGLITCMWAYLNGNMVVYGNIFRKLDEIGLGGLIASYTLIPLCIIITIIGYIESNVKNENLSNINKFLIILTIIVGFLGSKIYFIIPAIFILFKFYSPGIQFEKNSIKVLNDKEKYFDEQKNYTFENTLYESTKIYKNKKTSKNLDKTRVEIAIDLLVKGADKTFICELTSLSLKELEAIEYKLK